MLAKGVHGLRTRTNRMSVAVASRLVWKLKKGTVEYCYFPQILSGNEAAASNGNVSQGIGSPENPGLEVFRSIPRFSRREPMSVFMPPERAEELQLSEQFLSFLKGCLRYEPEERMTMQDMLRHPFLQVSE